MAIKLGRAGRLTRKQKQQKLAFEEARKSAQIRANKTGQPVRYGNETSQGFALPKEATAPKLTVDPETRAKLKAEREQLKAERGQRKAAREQRKAARQALTPKEKRQKQKSAQETRRAKKAAPTTKPTMPPMPTKTTTGSYTVNPNKPFKSIMNPRPLVNVSKEPQGSSNATGKMLGSMFSKGGVATKKAIGSNDYRKSGTTLSTKDNRKKK